MTTEDETSIYRVDLAADVVELVHDGEEVVNLTATEDGGARFLLADTTGSRVSLFDAGTRRIIWSTHMRTPLKSPEGAASPTSDSAVIEGGDRSLWTIDSKGHAKSTGFVTPDLVQTAIITGDGTAIVGGFNSDLTIVDTRRGSDVGQLCSEVSDVLWLTATRDGKRTGCNMPAGVAVWDTVAVIPTVEAEPAKGVNVPAPEGWRVDVKGKQLTVSDTSGSTVLDIEASADITAISFDKELNRVVFGCKNGGLYSAQSDAKGFVTTVLLWGSPDDSTITSVAAGASSAGISTITGLHYDIPICSDCGTLPGLLNWAAQRLTGCWRPEQLEMVSDRAKARLNLGLCQQWDEASG